MYKYRIVYYTVAAPPLPPISFVSIPHSATHTYPLWILSEKYPVRKQNRSLFILNFQNRVSFRLTINGPPPVANALTVT